MKTSLQKKMRHVLLDMRDEAELSAESHRDIDQLAKLNWSNDLAALARLAEFSPQSVERFLDLMVSQLHAFPEVESKRLEAASV